MKRRKSIRTIIIFLIIGIVIPTNLTTIIISGRLLKNMKSNILVNQQHELDMFTEQMENKLTSIEKYIIDTLTDDRWLGIGRDSKTSDFRIAWISLWRELNKQFNFISNDIDAIYVYSSQADQSFIAYNSETINATMKENILLWTKENIVTKSWKKIEINNYKYIGISYTNNDYNLGVLVRVDEILNNWMTRNGQELDILSESEIKKREGMHILSSTFMNSNMSIVCYLPKTYIDREIPVVFYLLFIFIVIGLVLSAIAFVVIELKIVSPLKKFSHKITTLDSIEKEHRVEGFESNQELYDLEKEFNILMERIYDYKIHTYEIELENQKAQLMSMRLQINPHMLLNTFNTIYSLSEMERYKGIQKLTMNLVKYFRYALKSTKELVEIKQEIDFINSYAEIQKIRYPDRFIIMYDIEENLKKVKIIPFIIHTFVENSMKYALNSDLVEIVVIIKEINHEIIISICDDGAGIDEEILEIISQEKPVIKEDGPHIGIWNSIRRLKLYYGENVEFKISSSPNEGTQIWMKIPRMKESD